MQILPFEHKSFESWTIEFNMDPVTVLLLLLLLLMISNISCAFLDKQYQKFMTCLQLSRHDLFFFFSVKTSKSLVTCATIDSKVGQSSAAGQGAARSPARWRSNIFHTSVNAAFAVTTSHHRAIC